MQSEVSTSTYKLNLLCGFHVSKWDFVLLSASYDSDHLRSRGGDEWCADETPLHTQKDFHPASSSLPQIWPIPSRDGHGHAWQPFGYTEYGHSFTKSFLRVSQNINALRHHYSYSKEPFAPFAVLTQSRWRVAGPRTKSCFALVCKTRLFKIWCKRGRQI